MVCRCKGMRHGADAREASDHRNQSTYPTPFNLGYSSPRPAAGNCSGAVRSWAGTAPPRAGNGPVLRGMSRPSPSPALMRPAAAECKSARRDPVPAGKHPKGRAVQKIAERAVLGSHPNFQKTRFETARLPLRSMARREKRAWQRVKIGPREKQDPRSCTSLIMLPYLQTNEWARLFRESVTTD